MTVIAYASANADPINNPSTNAQVDLSSATLPASVDIYGAAQDTTDPSATFTWAWSLLDGTATLSSTTTQNITLSGINTWHNIRLHLVATSSTGDVSESNILLAPSASFIEVEVLSVHAGIQKPATGQRSWSAAAEVWADKIEDLSSSTLNLGDLADVSRSTGPQVDQLTGGGVAEFNGSTLHTHDGDHVGVATTTTQGTVILEEASATPSTPKVITQERLVFTDSADGTHGWDVDPVNSTSIHTFSSRILATNQTIGTAKLYPQVIFYAKEDITVNWMEVTLYGVSSGTTYTIDFARWNSASDIGAHLYDETGSLQSRTSTSIESPLIITWNDTASVTAGQHFGPLITAPTSETGAAYRILVTIHATRAV